MVALQADELTPRILSPGMKLVSPGQLSSLEKKETVTRLARCILTEISAKEAKTAKVKEKRNCAGRQLGYINVQELEVRREEKKKC